MKKRILAFLLAVVMAFSILSALAHTEAYDLTRGKTRSAARIYETNSTKGSVLGKIGAGKTVVILWETESYYFVAYGSVCGYVQKKYVKASGDVVTANEYVRADRKIRLYKGNSARAGVLTTVGSGEWMTLISETENYYRVAWGSRVGYVLKKYTTRQGARLTAGEVANTVYETFDGEISMEIGEFGGGSGNEWNGMYVSFGKKADWYGILSSIDDAGEDGLSLTFKGHSDNAVICVEWYGREAIDFPVVYRVKNTADLPEDMFTDYGYSFKMTGAG